MKSQGWPIYRGELLVSGECTTIPSSFFIKTQLFTALGVCLSGWKKTPLLSKPRKNMQKHLPTFSPETTKKTTPTPTPCAMKTKPQPLPPEVAKNSRKMFPFRVPSWEAKWKPPRASVVFRPSLSIWWCNGGWNPAMAYHPRITRQWFQGGRIMLLGLNWKIFGWVRCRFVLFFFFAFSPICFFSLEEFWNKKSVGQPWSYVGCSFEGFKKPRRMDKCDIKRMVAVLRSAGIRIRWSMPILHSLWLKCLVEENC